MPHYSYSIYGVVAPMGVAVSADGNRIYATQTEGDPQVIAFDASGKQVASLKPPAETGAEHALAYVAVDPTTSNVYVIDRQTGSVYVYDRDGAYQRDYRPAEVADGWQPLGLAFDTGGNLYVTDVSGSQRVLEFDPAGNLVRTFGADEGLDFPNGVAVDGDGRVYVTDSNNGRLIVFDAAGTVVAKIGRGGGAGNLGLPRGIAIDEAGRVYIADVTEHCVGVYHVLATGDSQPGFIGQFGEEGSGDGGFRMPNAVAVDGRSRIYVADWGNDRIQIWIY